MTSQSPFMVLAPIARAREVTLRQLLASMNDASGRVIASNASVPFARFDGLHFARFVILDDKTLDDMGVYGIPARAFPLYLAFLGDVDGSADTFLEEAASRAPAGLRAIFACCEGFASDTDLVAWMKGHSAPAIANYVNWRGRTVRRIREESALKQVLDEYIRSHGPALAGIPPRETFLTLRRFVQAEQAAGRVALSDDVPTPPGWRLVNAMHLIGIPLLLLLALPVLVVLAPLLLFRLRRLEKTDPELCGRVDSAYSDTLASSEDLDVTNQFTAMGSLKPGLARLCTLIGVLAAVDYAARHIVSDGRLGRIRTIHFARWVFLDGKKRMVFFSNYDGTVESYMDDFINKTGFGLNAVFSNGVGYPNTNWLVRDGCANEEGYKNFLRRHTLPTQVWYKAYPGLTAVDLERHRRIREGLGSSTMTDEAARDWVALL